MKMKILSLFCVVSLLAMVLPATAFAVDDDSIIRTLELDVIAVDPYTDSVVTATFNLAETALGGTNTAKIVNNFVAVPTDVVELEFVSTGDCVAGSCPYKVEWDGKDSDAEPVMEGTYELHVSSEFDGFSDDDMIEIMVFHTEPLVMNLAVDKGEVNFAGGEILVIRYKEWYAHSDNHSLDINVVDSLGVEVDGINSVTQKAEVGEYFVYEATWDGLDSEGVLVEDGSYAVQVSIDNAEGTDTDTDEVAFEVVSGSLEDLIVDLSVSPDPVNFEAVETLTVTYKSNYFDNGEFFENLILDSNGVTVKDLEGGNKVGESEDYWVWELTWDGLDSAGVAVLAGTYTVSLTVENIDETGTDTDEFDFVVEVNPVDDPVDDPDDGSGGNSGGSGDDSDDQDQDLDYECGFPDVSTSHTYCDSILWSKDQGIFEGDSSGDFNPGEVINRAEVLAVVMRAFELELYDDDGTNLGWSDVITGGWYMKYLRSGKIHNLLHGDGDADTVRPSEGVNRVEFLKFIMQAALLTGENAFSMESCYVSPYLDVPAEVWFTGYACKAKDLQLFDTYDNLFLPARGTTRAEVAEALWRMMD